MSFADELLELAQDLANFHPESPRQANLRRAVSTAYYAIFHLLISEATLNWARGELRGQLGRIFEHGKMKSASESKVSDLNAYFKTNPAEGTERTIADNLGIVCNAFIQAQQRRNDADYNTARECTPMEVKIQIQEVTDEAWLLPVLEAMLEQFPFLLHGFHSDNGSEFINHVVARLLNNMLAEQTKSRPRHSNDNGLVESKNGAVVRKLMGYGHIAAAHAEAINGFYREHFNPYLNFHRPCGVPEVVTGSKGKQRRVYRWYATPWEILRQLPDLARHLKPGVMVEDLNKLAAKTSDTAAARRMQEARRKLFASFSRRRSA
jgi:uncharacterized protein (UPF0332 family)